MSGPRLSIIPAGAVVDPRLEGRDLQVLALLGCHTNDDGWCRRSQVKMAEQLRCARATVQAALKRLAEAGWVEHRREQRRDGGDASHWYRVRLDVAPAPEMESGAASGAAAGADDGPDTGTPPADLSAPPAGPGAAPPAGSGPAPLTNSPNDKDLTIPLSAPAGRERRARGDGAKDDDDEAGFGRFFERWLAAEPKHGVDLRGSAFAAWRRLSPEDRAAAADKAAIEAVVLEQRRAGRQRLHSATTYLRERMWSRLAPAARRDDGRVETLAAWSRHWWVRWWRTATSPERGALKAGLMADQARRGIACTVGIDEADEIRAAAPGFVFVLVTSPEFVAWREFLRLRRVTLPKPDRADRIFLPSVLPPDPELI